LKNKKDYDIPIDLINKYNKAIPRYTSYPTAPEWSEKFTNISAFESIKKDNENNDSKISLYVHIPFCWSLCFYCGCNVIPTRNKENSVKYLKYLEKEINLFSQNVNKNRIISQIHWGGGSPTYLCEKQIVQVFNMLKNNFDIDKDAEISIEIEPRTTTKAHLDTLKEIGFNRISMGIQDFSEKVQKTVNRIQTFEFTKDIIDYCRKLNFFSINTDLIYGLPYQNLKDFSKTLELINIINPDRIALFNFAYIPSVRPAQKKFSIESLPTPELKIELFKNAINNFIENGYVYIGLDHFAKPTDELYIAQKNKTLRRNFMGYTTKANTSLYAFGLTSISETKDSYIQNQKNLDAYYQDLDDDKLPVMRGLNLTKDDLIRKEIITNLTCNLEVSKKEISRKYQIDFDEYFKNELNDCKELENDGLIKIFDEKLIVEPKGQILIRNISAIWDLYLKKEGKKNLFSKTI